MQERETGRRTLDGQEKDETTRACIMIVDAIAGALPFSVSQQQQRTNQIGGGGERKESDGAMRGVGLIKEDDEATHEKMNDESNGYEHNSNG